MQYIMVKFKSQAGEKIFMWMETLGKEGRNISKTKEGCDTSDELNIKLVTIKNKNLQGNRRQPPSKNRGVQEWLCLNMYFKKRTVF